MSDYLLKIGDTKLKFILRGGYEIQENQEIILAKKTMADGTERRNIAEKRKTTIKITFSQIDGATLQEYCQLWLNDFTAKYWSKDDRMYKTAIFRVEKKPTNAMLYSPDEIFDEFDVVLESV
jgi:hypothetical protein